MIKKKRRNKKATYVQIGNEILKIKPAKGSRVIFKHTCEMCGERFVSNRNSSKFCSNACKQKDYRERQYL